MGAHTEHPSKFIGTAALEEPPSQVLVCSSSLEVCFDLFASLLDRTPSESVLSSIYCTKKKMKKGLSIAIRKKRYILIQKN